MVDRPALDRLQSFGWLETFENWKICPRLTALYSQDTIGVEVIEAELSVVNLRHPPITL